MERITDSQLKTVNDTSLLLDKGTDGTVNPASVYLRGLGKTSKITVTSYLNVLARMMGASTYLSISWGQFRRHHIQALLNKLADDSQHAPNTQNAYLSIMKGVAYEAYALAEMTADELKHIEAIPRRKGSRLSAGRLIPESDIKKLFQAIEVETTKGARDAAILALLLGCGLRRHEIVNVMLEKINFDEKSLTVVGKGNKERVVGIPEDCVSYLLDWVDHRGRHKGSLFTRVFKNGRLGSAPMTPQAVYSILEGLQTKAGITAISPHDCRKTLITTLLESNEDLLTVSAIAGHSDPNTTKQYDLRGKKEVLAAASRFKLPI